MYANSQAMGNLASDGTWELLRPKKCPKDEVTKISPPERDPDF
jgi:hypothetical protein